MHYSAKTSLLTKRFSADFSNITLTQHGSSDPLIFSGVGTISQNELGLLSLKLFQEVPLNTKKVFQYKDEKSGGKFSSSSGCSLRASEFGGGTWECDYLTTSESLCMGDGCTGVVSAYIEGLSLIQGMPFCFQKSSYEGIIPYELELPYNLCALGKKNSYPERMLKFSYNKAISVEILRCDGYTSVKISNKYELVSERFIEVFTQALSIATGRELKYIWQQVSGEQFSRRSISEFNFASSERVISPPLSLRYGLHLVGFLKAYLDFSLRHQHNYFGYWEKLHASWAAGLAVAALPLSVYIEGVMNEFYPELMQADAKAIKEASLAIEALRDLPGIDEKTRERISNGIRGATRKSVMNGLRGLVQRDYIDKDLASSWQYVRNRSAHGNDFTQEQVHAKIQEIVISIYSCLRLFYELLYLKLEFSGYVINYAKIGFPVEFRYSKRIKIKK